jgi:hypothetical protein
MKEGGKDKDPFAQYERPLNSRQRGRILKRIERIEADLIRLKAVTDEDWQKMPIDPPVPKEVFTEKLLNEKKRLEVRVRQADAASRRYHERYKHRRKNEQG